MGNLINQENINMLFTVVIFPLLGVLTTYLTMFVNQKIKEISSKTDSEKLRTYLALAKDEIIKVVKCVNQTYVDSLKESGKFDKDAQLIAFEMTKNTVLNTISDSVQEFLKLAIKDYDLWIETMIENAVIDNK